MGLRSVALSNLQLARKHTLGGGPPHSGKVSTGPYAGQEYTIVAARRGWPTWYRVLLTDKRGHVAERDIRESFL